MTATENSTRVLVFITNINTAADKQQVKAAIDACPVVDEWSVDTDDIDRVLRIVSHSAKAEQIIALINKAGYQCRELE